MLPQTGTTCASLRQLQVGVACNASPASIGTVAAIKASRRQTQAKDAATERCHVLVRAETGHMHAGYLAVASTQQQPAAQREPLDIWTRTVVRDLNLICVHMSPRRPRNIEVARRQKRLS